MKEGDKLYCIKSRKDPLYDDRFLVENGKIYTFDYYGPTKKQIALKEETFYYYSIKSFMTITEYRKNKLLQIKNEYEER